MELKQLRCFLAVAEELNFTRAAARLRMAQPALSRIIAVLEHELGAELFVRSKRRVALTPAGHTLLPHAHRIVNTTRQAHDDVLSVFRGERGLLSAGAIYSAFHSILPVGIRDFRAEYPGVTMRLNEMTIIEQINALNEGRLEVGIVRDPERHPAITGQMLFTEPYVAALPADHPLAAHPAVSLEELEPWPMVSATPYRGTRYGIKAFEYFTRTGLSPRISQEVDDASAIFAFVRAGAGYSIVPASFQCAQPRHVVFRPLANEGPTSAVHAIWRKDCVSRIRSRFVDRIQAAVSVCVAQGEIRLARTAGQDRIPRP